MGILRDAIGSAIQYSTESSQNQRLSPSRIRIAEFNRGSHYYNQACSSSDSEQQYGRYTPESDRQPRSQEKGKNTCELSPQPQQQHDQHQEDAPPAYSPYGHDERAIEQTRNSQLTDFCQQSTRDYFAPHTFPMAAEPFYDQGVAQPQSFRPLVLPQIQVGDGAPFIRAYSSELNRHGITLHQFITVLDEINMARIPNPEAQLFQKGASIAGNFIPGTGGIALMACQAGVGVTTHFGHASVVSKALSKFNAEVFAPKGLQICIGKTRDVDNELGISTYQQQRMPCATPAIDRVASYGPRVAFLTNILPDLPAQGRQDPIALAGRFFGQRSDQKKARRAQKRQDKGRRERLFFSGGEIEWLIVKVASDMSNGQW